MDILPWKGEHPNTTLIVKAIENDYETRETPTHPFIPNRDKESGFSKPQNLS